MTVTIIVLAVLCIVLMVQGLWLLDKHDAERQAWAVERQKLVDRAIARHAGEVIAFDRDGKPKPEREDQPPVFVEGLS
jgi:uncharacterized membrane protein YsdA (DUF1294 family)